VHCFFVLATALGHEIETRLWQASLFLRNGDSVIGESGGTEDGKSNGKEREAGFPGFPLPSKNLVSFIWENFSHPQFA